MDSEQFHTRIHALLAELQRCTDELARSYEVSRQDHEYWTEFGEYWLAVAMKLHDAGARVCGCGAPLIGFREIAEHRCDQRRQVAA